MTLAYVHAVQVFTSIKCLKRANSEVKRVYVSLQIAILRKYDVELFPDADAWAQF